MAKRKKKTALQVVKKVKKDKVVGDKLTSTKADRTQYCWNCLHYSKPQYKPPCAACFGVRDGKLFAYDNWKEGVDYVS